MHKHGYYDTTVTNPANKVLVAMSGGVDSSVAAAMLVEQGRDVVGCFMRLGSPGEALEEATGLSIASRGCCSINDAHDAREVAGHLGIPFYALNFKNDFGRVIDDFVSEYNAGRTPNPCIQCNNWLKFGRLHEYASHIGATHVASGHHARIVCGDDGPELRCGADSAKDQSYVLFGAPRRRLDEMLLPIGHMTKDQVREEARRLGLPVHDKPDSQDICFVPDGNYAAMIERRSPGSLREGDVLDSGGAVIGSHGGHQRFTIGQRRGLGIATGEPSYVIAKNPVTNTVTIGGESMLRSVGLFAGGVNWLVDAWEDWRSCRAKIRYNAPQVQVEVRGDHEHLEVRFQEPQLGVAPGQAVVCYDDDRVICGGWIEASL